MVGEFKDGVAAPGAHAAGGVDGRRGGAGADEVGGVRVLDVAADGLGTFLAKFSSEGLSSYMHGSFSSSDDRMVVSHFYAVYHWRIILNNVGMPPVFCNFEIANPINKHPVYE